MTPLVPSLPSRQAETEAQEALRLHQQERLARLFRKTEDRPDNHYLRDLIAHYREARSS